MVVELRDSRCIFINITSAQHRYYASKGFSKRANYIENLFVFLHLGIVREKRHKFKFRSNMEGCWKFNMLIFHKSVHQDCVHVLLNILIYTFRFDIKIFGKILY